jgi:hypothetical protein
LVALLFLRQQWHPQGKSVVSSSMWWQCHRSGGSVLEIVVSSARWQEQHSWGKAFCIQARLYFKIRAVVLEAEPLCLRWELCLKVGVVVLDVAAVSSRQSRHVKAGTVSLGWGSPCLTRCCCSRGGSVVFETGALSQGQSRTRPPS